MFTKPADLDAAFGRLGRAFATALSLGTDAGLAFVIAPIPAAGGQVLARLADRYSLVVHPYIIGTQVGSYGEFVTGSDRSAVLDLLSQLHSAHAAHAVHAAEPLADDFVVPHLDALRSMLSESCRTWDGGPYAKRAHDLLRAHATDRSTVSLTSCDSSSRRGCRLASRPRRAVSASLFRGPLRGPFHA